MIAPTKPQQPEPLQNLVLAITIDRPSAAYPNGYICMTAHTKPNPGGNEAVLYEDAADGEINQKTVEAVIRDLQSYVINGRKAFANDVDRDDERGRER
jgi:hypothetical protein